MTGALGSQVVGASRSPVPLTADPLPRPSRALPPASSRPTAVGESVVRVTVTIAGQRTDQRAVEVAHAARRSPRSSPRNSRSSCESGICGTFSRRGCLAPPIPLALTGRLFLKKLFYLGILALVCFEVANVYFIMPLPFSQRMQSIDVAYVLHSWRWAFRIAYGVLIVAGLLDAWRTNGRRRWMVPGLLLLAAGAAYATNVRMAADHIFLAPAALNMQPVERSTVDTTGLVVGVHIAGEARAYPIRFLGYHHQIVDSVGARPVMVSYCTVCRTGRVFDPSLDGRVETFRLVGMDHFNAMFEDRSTRSWWRQANGEAIAGPRRGRVLGSIPSQQVTLAAWLEMHPHSLIMQADSTLAHRYPKNLDFETGASRKALTGTDTVSWSEKAWVVGVAINDASRAYDWNRLRLERVINDELGGKPVVIVLAADDASFFAYERPDTATRFVLRGDSLIAPGKAYAVNGRGARGALVPLGASQEFWHSWRTFHPTTTTY